MMRIPPPCGGSSCQQGQQLDLLTGPHGAPRRGGAVPSGPHREQQRAGDWRSDPACWSCTSSEPCRRTLGVLEEEQGEAPDRRDEGDQEDLNEVRQTEENHREAWSWSTSPGGQQVTGRSAGHREVSRSQDGRQEELCITSSSTPWRTTPSPSGRYEQRQQEGDVRGDTRQNHKKGGAGGGEESTRGRR